MKILRIVSSGYEQGGIETHVALLQDAQTKRGDIIRIFSSDARPDLPHFNHYSYKTPSGWNKFIYGTFNPYAYWALKAALKDFKPDFVDIHSIGNASPAILFLLKKYPTVLTVHSAEGYTKNLLIWCFPPSYFKDGEYAIRNLRLMGKFRYFYHQTIGTFMYWLGFKNIDIVVTLSHYMHRTMEQEGLKNHYVPMGVTLFEYKALKEDTIAHMVAYVGRLEKQKGVDYLVKAFPTVVKKFPDAKLIIAGDGSEKSNLENLVSTLGISGNVVFLGHLDHTQLEKLYEDSSVVVMPSVGPEAFGKVGVEAMSVGRPVVATDVGGISDWLINGENGFLVPPKDSPAIANALVKMFEYKLKFMDMTQKARSKAVEFQLEQHIDEMEKVYRDLIS